MVDGMNANKSTEEHIKAQAKDSVAELRQQGWTGDASDYGPKHLRRDVDALTKRLGRFVTKNERAALDIAVRAELGVK